MSRVSLQCEQTLPAMLRDLPRACDRGTKCNAQGYKNSWNGYKLHIDTADCAVPVSALLTSASVHDSQTAVPLATMTASRVTNLYDLMDAAYCSIELQEHSRSLSHVPLIDHNPRGGETDEFEPADAVRYKERSQAERTNARLKDKFFVHLQQQPHLVRHVPERAFSRARTKLSPNCHPRPQRLVHRTD